MHRHRVIVLVASLGVLAAAPQRGQVFSFDADPPGAAPASLVLAAMRQDKPGEWLIRRDAANGVLVHRADAAATGLALALVATAGDREEIASVRLRLAGGAMAGGLVWRYIDPGNFYATLLDLARRELFLFRVTGGNRVFLESHDDLELDPAAWHVLKVDHDHEEIHVSLGGIRVFEDRDRRGERRPSLGRLGVIAAGNAEVWFDDLRVEPARGR
jgi:hypothetical protein